MRRISVLLLCLLAPFYSMVAHALTPQIEGLGEGGRAGIPKDALFSNAAAVGLLQQNTVFLSYSKTGIPDLGSGGRVQVAGVYDGTSAIAHGGLAYIRESRRRLIDGNPIYVDYTNIRGVFGRPIWKDLVAGIKPNYVIRKTAGQPDNKYFYGDLGFIYPLFTDVPLGITVENITNHESERPRSINAGIKYAFTGPLALYADGGRIFSARGSGKTSWALGAELSFFQELVVRGALFQDSFFKKRGFSTGISWFGPRTAFEYALRKTFYSPQEIDHIFGISISI